MKRLFNFHVLPAAVIVAVLIYSIIWSGCAKKEREEKGTVRTERLTIIFSSDLLGKVRSCGCTVEDMGGLGRRASYTENVRKSVRNLLVLDAGDAFGLELSYSQAEAELTFDTYELLGLDVFTPGEIDFIFGLDFLKRLAEQVTFDIVAANLVDTETNEPIFGPSYVVRELEGGTRIGITGILDDTIRFPGYIDTSQFTIISHEETLRRVLVEMKREADILILLSHMGLERSRTLAEEFADFDLIIVGHGKPVLKKTEQVGETMLLATGGLGQYIGRIDLFVTDAGDFQVRRMRIEALKDEIPVHEEVARIFKSYGVPLTEKEKK